MKKIGFADSASLMAESNTSVNDNLESISKKVSPSGSTYLMKLARATVNLSGRKHLKTKSFLKGKVSNFFQSNGNFSFSGVTVPYQSLNRAGASFSKF